MSTIDFQTSCYEKSYQLLLKEGLLINYLKHFPDTHFNEIRVLINNVYNKEEIKDFFKDYPNVVYYFTYDKPTEILASFGININSFYLTQLPFSIQHFTGLYYSHADYIFHVSEDCNIDNLDSSFINESLDMLESHDEYVSAMPGWDKNLKVPSGEALKEDGDFYICNKQTDQIYIIKTSIFKQKIYNWDSPYPWKDFPIKGGNSFEKRISSYMAHNKKYRVVHKKYYYLNGYYDSVIKGKK